MNPEITPEQQAQLNTWVGQRDSILKEIAEAKTEEEKLNNSNKNLSESNTEIANKIQQGIGRLEEINKKEEERKSLISSDLVILESKKTGLETTVSSLESDVAELESKKLSLLRDVANISAFHDHIFEKVNGMEAIVSKVIGISDENAKKIVEILNAAGAELEKVIEIGEKNVDKTNKLVSEIPQLIMNLHKGVLERRLVVKNRTDKEQK